VAADPINVVFVNALFTQQVDDHWQDHLPSWTTASASTNQFATDESGGCVPMDRERADGGNLALSRFHARMVPYGYGYDADPDATGYHVHVGAHHEEQGANFPAFPLLQVPVPCGHAISEDGFNRGRDEVYTGFLRVNHALLAWSEWGNTRSMRQCNGRDVAADGWTVFFDTVHAFDTTN